MDDGLGGFADPVLSDRVRADGPSESELSADKPEEACNRGEAFEPKCGVLAADELDDPPRGVEVGLGRSLSNTGGGTPRCGPKLGVGAAEPARELLCCCEND